MAVTILSGGQTGVDRAALDAALECGAPAGGWCPGGRRAEDGRIPERYPLIELPGAVYRQRTWKNVVDSDGTLIIYFAVLSGGTALTLKYCIDERQPYVLIDATAVPPERAAERITAFLKRGGIARLNVAGPRASSSPGIDAQAETLIVDVLSTKTS